MQTSIYGPHMLAYYANMDATLVIRRRLTFAEREFAEMVVWALPTLVPPTTHGFKYRLVYIVDGVRVIGFDNERGKGDHRHDGDLEIPYQFQDIDRLMDDFVLAVGQWRKAHGKD